MAQKKLTENPNLFIKIIHDLNAGILEPKKDIGGKSFVKRKQSLQLEFIPMLTS